ncbi:MAG: aldose 1-epimerase family protein, partial [Bacillota bacterium]|nr:aldose 1-epimerase family protein [Bacillota bacterium]
MSVTEIKNDYLSVGINTLGAELMYINSADKTEYLWNGDKEVWKGRAPILFPICGGLKEDKYIYDNNEYIQYKHGFAKGMEFTVENLSETKAEFVLTSSFDTLKG